MEKDTSIKVIYIAGYGHSGSTLLDIILGSNNDCFSSGELTFITRDTIWEEYCSCKKLIPDCKMWAEVIKTWDKEREISYQQYQRLRRQFERNKTTFRTLLNYYRPSVAFKNYCRATLQLFQAIQKTTGRSIIIDSSKSPQRIAVLSKIVDLQVIHLCRDFTGVLNSSKKPLYKDIKAGIEKDSPARKTMRVAFEWVLTNLITEIFRINVRSVKVFYENYVQSPASLQKVLPVAKQVQNKEFFTASHMLAGNVIRLQENLRINPDLGFKYDRLSTKQYKFARFIDKCFWFWK